MELKFQGQKTTSMKQHGKSDKTPRQLCKQFSLRGKENMINKIVLAYQIYKKLIFFFPKKKLQYTKNF